MLAESLANCHDISNLWQAQCTLSNIAVVRYSKKFTKNQTPYNFYKKNSEHRSGTADSESSGLNLSYPLTVLIMYEWVINIDCLKRV